MDSSSEDFEDLNCVEEADLDTLDDISDGGDGSGGGVCPKKPHFLDYDAAPPTGEELQYSCYSSLPASHSRQSLLRPEGNANDLDKNNASEKDGVAQPPPPAPLPVAANRVILTRRRSANEVQPPANTGTRKKEFPAAAAAPEVTPRAYQSRQTYHSLDYESVPSARNLGEKR